MARSKLDPEALRAFLDAGHTQAEATRYFGVSEAAIHQRRKRLGHLSARAAKSEVKADQVPPAADARVEHLQQVIEERLTWATDQARRNGADLVDTVFRLANDIRRDLALHRSLNSDEASDALGTTAGNRS